jgi:hypothetical protein
MSNLAAILAWAVITMAVFLIPVCVFALGYGRGILYRVRERLPRRIKERVPWRLDDGTRIQSILRDESAHYHPSLTRFTSLTKFYIFGMIFVMGVLFLRLALQYDTIVEAAPQPTYSLLLSMASSMVLLAMLAAPVFHLISLKHEIISKGENR